MYLFIVRWAGNHRVLYLSFSNEGQRGMGGAGFYYMVGIKLNDKMERR